jgi:hypothetical protein
MAHDRLRDSGLVQALTDLFADLAHLLRKELQLAKTEITEKIVSRLRASVWMVVAGVLGMVAVLLLIEAAVFGIASFGIALHWSCLIVAGVLIVGRRCVLPRPGGRRGRASSDPNRQTDLSDILGGEERIERFRFHVGRHADAGVTHG